MHIHNSFISECRQQQVLDGHDDGHEPHVERHPDFLRFQLERRQSRVKPHNVRVDHVQADPRADLRQHGLQHHRLHLAHVQHSLPRVDHVGEF